MRYALLQTTALVAAGLVAGEAYAAGQGVKLGIAGRYEGAAGAMITEDSGSGGVEDSHLDRGDVIKQDIEVHFNGEATLDNGVTVGAHISLEGQTDTIDQIDETYAYLKGGFGELRIGDDDDALASLCYLVPRGSNLFGADSPEFNFSNAGVFGYGATNGTCYGLSDNSTKLIYFSPSFAGFQLGLSYAPDGTEDSRNTLNGFGTRSDSDQPFQNSEVYSAALTFDREFGGVHIIAGGGATLAQDVEGGSTLLDVGQVSKPREYDAYAQVSFGVGDGTLTVGGAWALRTNLRTNEVTVAVPGVGDQVASVDTANDEVYGVGITYGLDAWSLGLSATRGRYESTCAGGCADQHDIVTLDGSYKLGPGVNIEGMVEYDDYDPDDGDDAKDYSSVSTGVGLFIAF